MNEFEKNDYPGQPQEEAQGETREMGDQGGSSSWEQGASSWETASYADTAAQGGQGSGRESGASSAGENHDTASSPKEETGWVYGNQSYYHNPSQGGQSTSAGGAYQSDYGGQQGYQQPYSDYRSTGSAANNHQRVSPNPYRYNFDEYEAAAKQGKGSRKNRGIVAFLSILCIVFVLTGLMFAGVGVYRLVSEEDSSGTHDNAQLPQSGETDAQSGLVLENKPDVSDTLSEDGSLTTAQIQKKVRPSVVGVIKYQAAYPFTAAGEGSGIIMSADGYIVTNAHVVSDADEIGVVLANGEDYVAQLVGIDTKTDLAVLKIEAENLSYAEFGNSDQLEVGEKAVAIGYPGGIEFGGSTTEGIISGLNRVVKSSDGTGNAITYIQTDAAINPGNSGGALINRFGQVIGINSAKVSNVDYEGIGFAIPINEAKPIIDELMENGRVTGRVKIGITVQPVTEALSKLNDVPQGVRIISIEADSDAAAKNLMVGDIITKINEQEIYSNSDVATALEGLTPGQTIRMTIYRKTSTGSQKTFEVNVELQEDVENALPDLVPTAQSGEKS